MPAASVDIANAVVSEIEAAALSQTVFVIERSYADWQLELEEADELRVDVVPVLTAQTAELASRGSIAYMVPIAIVVRQRFGREGQNVDTGRIEIATIDALVLFCQELHELFSAMRLTDFTAGVNVQDAMLEAVPVPDHLLTMNQFTGIIRVFFEAELALA